MRHFENAVYGVLDYLAYPLGMLALAPVLIHALGAAHFGIWAFVMAVANTGAILGSGFGDANIQQLAAARRNTDLIRVGNCIRVTLTIHVSLGLTLALLICATAPAMANRVAVGPSDLAICTTSLRIAGIAVFFRTLETVAVSTQRAFERYGEAVRISAIVRVMSLLVAAAAAIAGFSLTVILACTTLMLAIGTVGQFLRLQRSVPSRSLIPGFEHDSARQLLSFGIFTWMQAAAGVVFAQVDRLLIGLSFGSVAVGTYIVCMQLAQPIWGTAASALHFLFPYLARTGGDACVSATRKRVAAAFLCNLILVAGESAVLLAFGGRLLHIFLGAAITQGGTTLLRLAILGSAFAGLATAGIYAMLALAQARWVFLSMLASGIGMLSVLPWLAHHHGIAGVAASRVLYGVISLTVYIPLIRLLKSTPARALVSEFQTAAPQESA